MKFQKNHNVKKITKRLSFFSLFVFIVSCDFTPRLHKKILEAQANIKIQNYDKAIFLYKRIIRNNPSQKIKIKLYYQLGELYSTYLSNNKEGLKYFKRIKDESQDPLWLIKSEERIAEINFNFEKDYNKSIKSYKLLINFEPRLEKYDYYKFRLALTYYKLNKFSEAERLFIEIKDDKITIYSVKGHYYLGLIKFHQKKWQNAIKIWKHYIRREKNRASIIQAKYLMANAYETMEKLKQAYNIYYSILGEYPNTEVIQNRLNTIYDRRVARKR